MTDEQLLAEHEATHPYPAGEVMGPCVCGSWPGGVCLKCRRIITPTAIRARSAVADTPVQR